MVRILAALVIAALTGCATLTPEQQMARDLDPNRRVLCVADLSAGYGSITVRTASGEKFNPWSGEQVCKEVTIFSGGLAMSVTSVGGGLGGRLRGEMVFQAVDDACMVWRIRGVRDGENDFVPCSWHRNTKMRATMAYDADPGIDGQWAGFTQCEGFPASFLNVTQGVVPTEKEAMVRRHEQVHRDQMNRYGSCDAWKRAIGQDPMVRVRHEAEAHCESAKFEYARGAHPSLLTAMLEQAAWFSWYFWNGNTRKALDAMAPFCG